MTTIFETTYKSIHIGLYEKSERLYYYQNVNNEISQNQQTFTLSMRFCAVQYKEEESTILCWTEDLLPVVFYPQRYFTIDPFGTFMSILKISEEARWLARIFDTSDASSMTFLTCSVTTIDLDQVRKFIEWYYSITKGPVQVQSSSS